MENKNYDTSLAALQAFMHSFSRSPLATGQIYLDQATGKSGHTIHTRDIRAESIPVYTSKLSIRVGLLDQETNNVVDKYASTIKYLDKVLMTEVPDTNKRSWYIKTSDGEALRDFIAPTDALTEGGALSNRICYRNL